MFQKKERGRSPEVQFIRRVDMEESSDSDGDEYDYTDTERRDALDIVRTDDGYYAVRTKTEYEHSYDQYESPMNTYSERVTLEICPLRETMLDSDRETLLAYMDEDRSGTVWGGCDSVTYPDRDFVTAQVARALKKHADEKRVAEKKAAGECKPNAVRIAYDGEPEAIYIDDFTTNEGLSRALGCDAVTVTSMAGHPEIACFYNAKIKYGIPYNHVASAVFGHALEGPVVTCGRAEDGSCIPFPEDQVEDIVRIISVKKAMIRR